ncbi:MAG: sigma-54 dependent DNA-binding response regulator Fis family protein, partial [Halothiobacillaceae bacterium]
MREILLVVEDNPGLRRQLKWAFPDHEVVFGEDRPSALKQVELLRPPVVTLDLGLPPDAAN